MSQKNQKKNPPRGWTKWWKDYESFSGGCGRLIRRHAKLKVADDWKRKQVGVYLVCGVRRMCGRRRRKVYGRAGWEGEGWKKRETRASRIKRAEKHFAGHASWLRPATPQVSLLLSFRDWDWKMGWFVITEALNGNEHELVHLYELKG